MRAKRVALASLIAVLAVNSACTVMRAPQRDAATTPVEEATVVPEPVAAEPPPSAAPSPAAAATAPMRVLVLRSSDSASYAEVADALDRRLGDRFDLAQVSLSELEAGARASAIGPADWAAAIAIGADAARLAGESLDVPTVFCQIFDYAPLLAQRETLFGVEALPPLALQLRSWQRLAPEVQSVGIIVGKEDAALVDAAQQAAAETGIELHVAFAASDRELLYRFKRIATDLDGLWLFPDSDILSPLVLREVFGYALDHGVHSIVFSPALLDWGALLSVASDADDVAATAARVIESLLSGRADELPRVTPLSAVDARVNEEIAADLGLPATIVGARLEAAAR